MQVLSGPPQTCVEDPDDVPSDDGEQSTIGGEGGHGGHIEAGGYRYARIV
jgi:hypothetical protein